MIHRNTRRREFVLPDGISNFRGYVRELPSQQGQPRQAGGQPGQTSQPQAGPSGGAGGPGQQQQPQAGQQQQQRKPANVQGGDQALVLNNERFMVPEVRLGHLIQGSSSLTFGCMLHAMSCAAFADVCCCCS